MQKKKTQKVELPPVTYNGRKYVADARLAINAKGEAVELEDLPPSGKYR